MTGCLFFLYIGALGLPVSIQLHCLMLPYSMQTEDEEKGIYKGITGCMPLYVMRRSRWKQMGRILLQPIFCWKEETSRMRFWKQRIT